MKKLVLAAALTGFASFASAGGLNEAAMEGEVAMGEMEEMMEAEAAAGGSSNGLVIPLILLALLALGS